MRVPRQDLTYWDDDREDRRQCWDDRLVRKHISEAGLILEFVALLIPGDVRSIRCIRIAMAKELDNSSSNGAAVLVKRQGQTIFRKVMSETARGTLGVGTV